MVVEKAQEVGIDLYMGKQQQLGVAMEKIAKDKQKYLSVNSIKGLAKKPPNLIKGKGLME